MSDAETVILSDDDEVLEQRRVRQLPRIMDIRSVQFRRQGDQLQREEHEQQQEHEQPNIMMVMQALMQMQQMNQQMQQTQQQTTQQILQILQVLQQQDNRFAAHDVRLQQLENGGGDRDGPVRYLRAVRPQGPAPAPADAGQRRNARYTPDEDLRIVQYLIEGNAVDRAKSDSVWQEMRRDDPVIAKRTVSSLKQRFRTHIWPKVMAGQYTEDPQILHKFGRIWPQRMFQAA